MPCMRALAALCSGGLCRDMRPPRWREWAGHESMRVKESLDAEADDVEECFQEVDDEWLLWLLSLREPACSASKGS